VVSSVVAVEPRLLVGTASPSAVTVVAVVAEPVVAVASAVVSVVVKLEVAIDTSPVEAVTVVARLVVVTASSWVVTVVAVVSRVVDKLSDKPSLVCVSIPPELSVEIPVETLTESSVVRLSVVDVRLDTSVDKSVVVSLVTTETAREVIGFGLQGLAKTSNECKAEAKQNERTRRRAISSHNARKSTTEKAHTIPRGWVGSTHL